MSATTTPAAGQQTRPHVLYVAWGYPPSRGGGVYRALATANAFAEAGYRVTVLTATRETFVKYTGADFSLEDEIAPGIDVVRIPFPWPALEIDVRQWSAMRTFATERWRKRQLRRDVSSFPEASYGPWRKPLERAALAIHRAQPVDLVVASANPNVDFMAADVLNRRHGVPYVMDYRDAWMLDVFDGELLHPEGGRVDLLEKDLLSRAQEVWFVNEPIRAWHAQRHPALADRMHVVANGYDPELAPQARFAARDGDRPLTFGYIGTVSRKVPLPEFNAGWAIARTTFSELEGAEAHFWGHLGFFSLPSPDLLRLIQDHADQGVRHLGAAPKTQVRQIYDGFDALLLLLGAGRYVTSGKVFEYAASALPIVSVHDPSNAATDVLRGYPLWFPVSDLSAPAIADALGQAARAARTAGEPVRRECAQFAGRYARDLQLRPRVLALKEQVTRQDATARGSDGVTA